MKTSLSKELLDLLVQSMAASGIPELENAKQVIEQSGFSDKDTAPVLEQIDAKIEEIKAANEQSNEVLDSKEVKDHVKAAVDEATAEAGTKVTEATEAKDTAEAALKTNTIESIISYSSVLRKDSIDFENVESSVAKLRDELSSKSNDELKDSLAVLAEEIKKTFLNSPSKKLADEVNRANGQEEPNNNNASDDKGNKKQVAPTGMPEFLERVIRGPKAKSEK